MALHINFREGHAARYFVVHGRREDVKGVLIIRGGDAAEGIARRLRVEELARLRGAAVALLASEAMAGVSVGAVRTRRPYRGGDRGVESP